MKKVILDVKELRKSYWIARKTQIEVLRGIDFTLCEGEWVALLGASGCGKTTLLNVLGTLERPDSGDVIYKGFSYNDLSSRELAKLRNTQIGFIFQAYHLIPELSVLGNVLIPNQLSPNPVSNIKEKACELLDALKLSHRLKHFPSELSGGEQQRVAIARALINNPAMLLADEPTGNLDRANGESILSILKDYHRNRSEQMTIVMITHDPDVARHADRVIHLQDGRIRA